MLNGQTDGTPKIRENLRNSHLHWRFYFAKHEQQFERETLFGHTNFLIYLRLSTAKCWGFLIL